MDSSTVQLTKKVLKKKKYQLKKSPGKSPSAKSNRNKHQLLRIVSRLEFLIKNLKANPTLIALSKNK